MCGGCAGAPLDWAADLVSGPRRRAAVARRLSMLLRRDTIRAIPSGWVVAGPTGSSVVCRTYDELVEAVSRRSQTAVDDIRHLGLGDPARTA